MLRVTKRKLTILAAAIVAALGLTVVTAGSAFAWEDKKIEVTADCDQLVLNASGFKEGGHLADSAEYWIFKVPATEGDEPVRAGTIVPDQNGEATETLESLPNGSYKLEWMLVLTRDDDGKPKNFEKGETQKFEVTDCAAKPDAAAEADCENEGIKVTLDNTGGSAEADFTVTVGDEVKMQAVAAGETADVSFGPLDDGAYTVVVTEVSTKFEKSFDLTVECVEDETPPPTEPTPTPTVQGSTLPHTGAGFPTGAAAAFALLLVSVGGFLLTYRKGLLPLPFMHRH